MAFDYGSGYQFDPEKQKAFSGMWSKIGKENESSSFDGGSGGGVAGGDWGKVKKALGVASAFASGFGGGRDKYRDKAEDWKSFGPRQIGYGRYGEGGQLLDNFAYLNPPQAAPFVFPGEGSTGKSTGQRIAGGLSGALSGAATGAAFGPVGAVVGGLIGGAGGAFA